MTAPQYIALVIGLIAAAMIWASQHGLGTRNPAPPDPPDGEPP